MTTVCPRPSGANALYTEYALRLARLLVPVLLICATGARANDQADIKALHAKLATALRTNDAAAMHKLEAPGFVAIEHGKKVSAPQFEAQIKQRAAAVQHAPTGSIQVSSIQIKGRTAQVVSTYHFEGPVPAGPGAPPGPTHTFGMMGPMLTTLLKTPQGWRFTSMNQQFGTALIDGKPFNSGPMPAAKLHR